MYTQFDIQPTIDGYAVIDLISGRPVDQRSTAREANGVKFKLNQAAAAGSRQLFAALGAPEGRVGFKTGALR